ncbi:DinB family protein [Alteribacter populi]|uniref:DinB family protein n=1 Tax=Alteribacter populi TaxID=2011011 RepID=UPI000BBAC1E2|nr:DinB family protein [Alteribacter populi]
MKTFFEYNWQVRDEWFDWCRQLPADEWLKRRVGGTGSILFTLFHIVDAEYSWLRAICGKKDIELQFSDYNTVEKVQLLSDTCRMEVEDLLSACLEEANEDELITAPWIQGQFEKSEIIHHVIAHEIHHVGQLSIWARELKLQPVSANFIGRGLKPVKNS